MVGDRLVGGSVVRGFCLCTLVEAYFVILILIFPILTIKKKQIGSPEAVTRIFNYS